jgi:hypothetical protein
MLVDEGNTDSFCRAKTAADISDGLTLLVTG